MFISIRRFMALFVLAVVFAVAPVLGVDYPTREVRMVVPWNAGGSNDIMARVIQPLMEKEGIKIIVENVPGGGSAVGLGQVANAKPDGYMLGWGTSSILSIIAEGKVPLKLPQFTILTRASEDPLILLVSKNSPHKDLKSFMENLKTNPGTVTIGTPGARNVNDLLAMMVSKAAGSKHRSIPYPGGSRVVAELMGGQIDAAVLKPGETMQVMQSGDLIPIGIFTDERSLILPDVPTFKEIGYEVFSSGPLKQISFIMAPANLPMDIKEKLVTAFTTVFSSKEFQDFASTNGFVANPLSGKELEDDIVAVEQTLGQILKEVTAK